jgi:hypothetical protein
MLSKGRTHRVDQHFKTLSSALRALGTKFQDSGRFEKPLMIKVQSAWLTLYKGFYLHPPQNIEPREQWRGRMDQVGAALGSLRQEIEAMHKDLAHKTILHVQTLLVNLYDTTLSKPSFFRRNKMLQSLLSLFLRSRDAENQADIQVLKARIQRGWKTHYVSLSSRLKEQIPPDEWNQKLQVFLKISRKDFERKGSKFFDGLAKQHWEDLRYEP